MSDDTDQATEQTEDTEVNLGDAGKKALDLMKRERNAARDAAKGLQEQLDRIKQEQMSDLEKAQAQARDFEAAATAAHAEALRWRIAARHGISDADAETFLTGNDEASLTKQAERLSAMAASAPTTPKPDATQGGSGTPPALNSDQLESSLRAKLGIT